MSQRFDASFALVGWALQGIVSVGRSVGGCPRVVVIVGRPAPFWPIDHGHEKRRPFVCPRRSQQPPRPTLPPSLDMALVATPTTPDMKRSVSAANLDDHVGGHHDDLSPLAKRIPKVRRVGDANEQRRKELQRSCLVRLVDWSVKHEELVPKVWSALEAGQILLDDGPPAGCFAEPPKTVRHIEKSWKASFIVDLAGGAISNALMSKIDAVDEHAIQEIFAMLTKTVGSESLPRDFVDQRMLASAMRARHQQVLADFDMKAWVKEHISASGAISWERAGPYTYVFSKEGQLVSVKHVTGATAEVPKHMVIDTAFTLKNCAYDMMAQFFLGPVLHMVYKLFPKGEGPNKFGFDRNGAVMRSLLGAAQACVRDADRASNIASDEGLQSKDHAKERRAAALEKAREKIRGSAAKEKGRCIQLASLVS